MADKEQQWTISNRNAPKRRKKKKIGEGEVRKKQTKTGNKNNNKKLQCVSTTNVFVYSLPNESYQFHNALILCLLHVSGGEGEMGWM